MDRTGFGGSSRCWRTEVKAKVWVSVDLRSAGELPAAGSFTIRSLSEYRGGDEHFIRAVVSDGRRDEEIWGKGRDRVEAIRTGLRRYRLFG